MLREIKILLSYCSNINKIKFIFFSLLSSFFETFSLALIFSIIIIYFQQSQDFNFLFFSLDLNSINFNIIIISLIFVIILKTLYLNFFSWWRNNFVYNFNTGISNKIFKSYLNRNYEFHLYKDSSEFVRNTFNESRIYSTNLDIILKSFSELVLLFFILIFLLFYNFYITAISLVIIFTIALLYLSLSTKKLKNLSKLKTIFVKNILKNIREGYDYIKEIKIYNLKNFFINKFDTNLKELNSATKWSAILIEIPKNSLELFILFFLGILYYLFSSINFEISETNFVILIASYGTAAMKIIPSSLRLINYLSTISNSIISLREVNDQLSFKNFETNTDLELYNSRNLIEVKNLDFFYEKNKKFYLDNLNFKMETGEIIFFKGESGIGKSTLLNLICGLIKQKKGEILCNNNDISSNYLGWFEGISYVSQGSRLIDDTILKNIIFENSFDKSKLDYAIKNSNSQEFINSHNKKLDYIVGENGSNLSGGQAQRIILARAIYKNPKILILDEFTSALDADNEKQIFESLEILKKDRIILISSHNSFVSSISDRTLELKRSSDDYKKILIREI